MKYEIWLSPPHLTGEELDYINMALSTNLIASQGASIDKFENKIKDYLEVPEVLALNSGTSAIHLGLIELDVEIGDEVICQNFTFSASVNPILYLGATPIFVDSEEDTWNICPNLLEEAIIDRIAKGKKPKAIIAVHLYGMPYKVDEVNAISEKYGIPILEDAAEALGSTYKGRPCGSLGNLAILSFNGNKIITTSSGGALICKDKDTKERLKHLATQAKDDAVHYQHSSIGYNYRMSNVLAGIGEAQINLIKERVQQRRNNHLNYKKYLDEAYPLLTEPNGSFSNRWLNCILTESYQTRESIRLILAENHIESKPLWKPMHLQPIFLEYPKYLNGVSEKLFEIGLCLPSGSNLEEDDIHKICNLINTHATKSVI